MMNLLNKSINMKLIAALGFSLLLVINTLSAQEDWQEIGEIPGLSGAAFSGLHVDISGDGNRVVVGGNYQTNSASRSPYIAVYEYNGTSWNLVNSLISLPIRANDAKISEDGKRIAIAVPAETGIDFAYVAVYEDTGSNWVQLGSNIFSAQTDGSFGKKISASSDCLRIAIGYQSDDTNANNAGSVLVYSYEGSDWVQAGQTIFGSQSNSNTGIDVALSGDGLSLLVSDRLATNEGQLTIFGFENEQWIQKGNIIKSGVAESGFGSTLSINDDGSIIAAGSSFVTNTSRASQYVRVFELIGSFWGQRGQDLKSNIREDLYGSSIALNSSGSRVVVSAGPFDLTESPVQGLIYAYEFENESWKELGSNIKISLGSSGGPDVAISSDGLMICAGDPIGIEFAGRTVVFQVISDLLANYSFTGSFLDNSINSNIATNSGGVLTTDRFGKSESAIFFDGVSQVSSPLTSQPTAISLWYKADQSGGTIFSWGEEESLGYQYGYQLSSTNAGLLFYLSLFDGANSPYSTTVSLASVSDNDWHQFVMTNESGVLRFYIDNVFVQSYTPSSDQIYWEGSSGQLVFGESFQGTIDDITFYSEALTSLEIEEAFVDAGGAVLIADYGFTGNVNDNSGLSNNGVNFGATFTTDRFGFGSSALSFFSDYVSVNNTESLADLSGSYSASMWVNIQSATPPAQMTIISKGLNPDDDTNTNLSVYVNTDLTLTFFWEDEFDQDNIITTTESLAPFRYYLISVTVDTESNISSVYVDKELVAFETFLSPPSSNIDPLYIGAAFTENTRGNFFFGVIDDIKIYNNKVLSLEEISTAYEVNGWNPDLLGDFTFNGGAGDESNNANIGSTIGSGISLAQNRFGNDNNAFLFGGAGYVAHPHIDSYTLGQTSDFSISGWFNSSSTSNGVMFDKSDGSVGYFVQLSANGSIQFSLNSTDESFNLNTNAGYNDGKWHYFVAQADRNANISIIVDGFNIFSNSLITENVGFDTSEDLLIGANAGAGNANPNSLFSGSLDDIQFWSRLLTAKEVGDVYNNGVASVSIVGSTLSTNIDLELQGSLGQTFSAWSTVIDVLEPGPVNFYYNGTSESIYGDSDLDGLLEVGGTDISISKAGQYYVSVRPSTNEYVISEITSVGVLGDAIGGSDVDDTNLIHLGSGVYLIESINLSDGEIKFRANDTWDVNWGDDDPNGIVSAQLLATFEEESPAFVSFGGNQTQVISNPDASGINTSGSVVETVRGSELFGGTFFDVEEKLELTTESTITLKVWAPEEGFTFRIKLEDKSNSNIFQEFDLPIPVSQEWTVLTFSLNNDVLGMPAASQAYDRIVFFPGYDAPTEGSVFYFDDVILGYENATVFGGNIPITEGKYVIFFDVVENVYSIFNSSKSGINLLDQEIIASTGLYTDSGGAENDYTSYEDYLTTIYPEIGGEAIQLEFTEFNVETNYDFLYVFDGTDIGAPLIGVYSGNINESGSNVPDIITATNNNGALTTRFVSDQLVNTSGWQANISTVLLPAPEIVAEYFFNDNVEDNSGLGNNGVNNNAVYVEGRLPIDLYGGAYSFDGSTAYLAVQDSWSLSRATENDFSVSGWFKSSDNGILFDKSDGFTGYFGALQSTGSLFFYMVEDGFGVASVETTSTWNDGNWHFFTMEADRDTGLAIYVDNNLDASSNGVSDAFSVTTSEDLLIGVAGQAGNTNLNGFFSGELDDFRLHSKVLTPSEKFELYNVDNWFDSVNLLSYLKYSGNDLDEQSPGNSGITFTGTLQSDRFENESSALFLDGISQYNAHTSEVFLQASKPSLDQSGSISVWINPESNPTGTYTIYQFVNPGTFARFMTELNLESDGRLGVTMWGVNSSNLTMPSNAQIKLQSWTHVAATWDVPNGVLEVYINGVLDNSVDISTVVPVPLESGMNFIKGYNLTSSANYYQGGLDDIKVFKNRLNGQQVLEIFNEGGWPSQLVTDITAIISSDTDSREVTLRQESETGVLNWSESLYLNSGENLIFRLTSNGEELFYGDIDGADNIADIDGSQIVVDQSSDHYIRYNASTNEFLVYPISSIGFLGSARTGDETGWQGDDDDFQNEGEGNYTLRNISLFDGAFKFRANNDWSILNWGDGDADGTMEIGGIDTEVIGGSYDITFNVYDRTYFVTPTLSNPIISFASPISSTEIKLVWENAENETGYNLFRAPDLLNRSFEFVAQVEADITEFTDSGLIPNNGYSYIIQVFNDQISNQSGEVVTSTFSNNIETNNENITLLGGSGNDFGRDITFDDQGNYYVLGTFNGTTQIAGIGIGALNNGLFVAKYNSAHVVQWVYDVDPAAGSIDGADIIANAIGIAPNGEIYITGYYSGIVNNVASYQASTNNYENNLFLIKLNQEGTLLDTRIISSPGFSSGYDIDFDNESNVYVSGIYSGGATFSGTNLSGGGPIVLKWEADGSESWVIEATQSTLDLIGRAFGIAYDKTNEKLYVTGISYGATDFSNNGSGIWNGSVLNYDAFLASYNADASFNWVSGLNSGRTDVSYDVTLDPANNPIIAGYFNGAALTIGSKSYNNESLSNEILIVKYDQSGEVLNSVVATSGLSEYTLGMSGNGTDIFITGYKDPVATDFAGLIVENGKGFLASFDGNTLVPNWVEVVEGNSIGVSVAASQDYVYLAGRATNTINLAGNVLSSNNESADAMFGVFDISSVSTAGLVGYYTFDNSSTEDFSGNGNNGVAVNNPLFSKDRFGKNGSSFEPENNQAFIEIPHNGDFNFTSEFSVAMWVRLNDYSNEERDVLFKDDGFGLLSINRDGLVAYDWQDSNNDNIGLLSTDLVVSRNEWTFITLSIDGNGNASIFIDGVAQKNQFQRNATNIGAPATTLNVSLPVNVGNTAFLSSNVFNDSFLSDANGDIDDVRIYSGASLTQSEVIAIYQKEIPGGANRLVAQYEFTLGDLNDISENSFDGLFRDVNNNAIGAQLTTGLDGDSDGALDFQDNGDYMEVFHERSINLSKNVTVNLWVRPDAVSNGTVGDVLFSDAVGTRLMYDPQNRIYYHYETSEGAFPEIKETGNSLEIGAWQMITYSIDENDNLIIYKNGVEILSSFISDQAYKLAANFTVAQNDIASPSDLRYMDGAIDKVSVYKRVLSQGEIAQIFNEDDKRLLAYYPFDGDVLDYSANEYDGTAQDLSPINDRFGDANDAYSFNGSSSQVTADLLNHPQGEASFTYMAWINPAVSSQSATIISVGEDIDNGRSSLFINGNALAYIGNSNDVTSSITIPSDQWSHVAIAKTGTNIDFFLNGNFVETLTTSPGQNLQSTSATIGSTFGTREFFNGGIDEVRIFSIFLTGDEIMAIYNAEAPISSLVADYPLFQNANDFGGNDYHGTELGGAFYNDALVIGDNGNDAVSLPNDVMSGLNDFTVMTAVKFNTIHTSGSVSSNTIISGSNVNTDNAFVLGLETGNQWLLSVDNNFQRVAANSIEADMWYHIAFVRKDAEIAVFVAGQNVGSVFVNNTPVDVGIGGLFLGQEQDVFGGGFQQDQSLAGQLSNLKFFSEALSTSQILEISIKDTPQDLPPLAPSNVVAQVIAPGMVRVNWSDNSDNESGFYVDYNDGSSFFTSDRTNADVTSLLIENLSNDVSYTFDVHAFNANGDAQGENSATATPVVLGDPISVNPGFPSLDDEITITVTVANLYPVGTLGTADKIYLHSGLIEPGNENAGGWVANAEWGVDHGVGLMTNNGDGTWSIIIPDPRSYYQVADDFVASQIALLFRNADGTASGNGAYNTDIGTGDIFIDLYDDVLYPKPGSAVATLDGTNNLFINDPYPNETSLIGNAQLTLEAWVNTNQLPESDNFYNIYTRATSVGFPIDLYVLNQSGSYFIVFSIENEDRTETGFVSTPISAEFVGQWHHISATYDGVEMRLYVDGYLVSQTSSSVVLPLTTNSTSDDIIVGNLMKGQIDDVRLWSFAKSLDQIRREISFELGGSETNLAANWNFNTITGSGPFFTPDITGNGNDLRLSTDDILGNPDLSVSVVNSPSAVVVGGSNYVVTGTIINTDQAELPINEQMSLVLYLSEDTNFDAGDLTLATNSESVNLVVNSSQSYSINFNMPSGIEAKGYNLIVRVDDSELISESNEANNISVTPISVLSVLNQPTSLVLSNADNTTFDYSWNALDASDWRFDIASDDAFNTILSGYSNIETNTTSGTISNLDLGTTYYMRVRAFDPNVDQRESGYSNTSQITTLNFVDTQAPTISISAPDKSEVSSQIVTISVSDNVEVAYVDFYVRSASESAGSETVRRFDFPSNSFNADILVNDWDNFGVTFYAIAGDAENNTTTSNILTIVADIPSSQQETIPVNATGLTSADYKIFAFPYENKGTAEVVDGGLSPIDWRIQRYNGNSNSDQTTLSAGAGYWFLKRASSTSLTFSNASPVSLNGDHFEINLREGYTQIGNPYLGAIDWNEVLIYNNLIQGQISQEIQTYSGGYSTATELKKYEGGFVLSDAVRSIEIPISAINRSAQNSAPLFVQDGGWELPVYLTAPDEYNFRASGFGQYDKALDGKDGFDLRTPMLFEQYVRAEFVEKPTLEGKRISKSIHSNNANDIWIMKVYSHFFEGVTMNIEIGDLPELAHGDIIAMLDLQTGHHEILTDKFNYSFNYADGYEIKFIKGSPEFIKQNILLNELVFSEIYPNPSNGVINLALNTPAFENAQNVHFNLFDLSGQLVLSQDILLNSGYQEIQLSMTENGLSNGLYLLEIEISHNSVQLLENITKKVFLKRSE
jgi:hypothetical protein